MTKIGFLVLGAALALVGLAVVQIVWDDAGPATPDAPTASAVPEGEEELKRREEWFYAQRATVGDTVQVKAFLNARRSIAARSASTVGRLEWTELGPSAIGTGGPEPNADLNWTWGGPTPYSGRVSAIVHHPTRPNVAYVGTSGGGVWKTEDDGRTWTPLFDRQPSLAIGALAIDPNDPETLYAGTGEANDGTPAYFGAGVFKTTNGGRDWTKLPVPHFDECHISGIGVQAGNSDIVIVTANGYGKNRWEGWRDRCTERNGLWLSEDGGDSFRRVLKGRPRDLAPSPGAPSVWYAAFERFGIYKSVDSGRSWNPLVLPVDVNTGRVDIDVAASRDGRTQVVYAAVANSSAQLQGVYRSLDGGGTWEKLRTPVAPEANVTYHPDACSGQCDYDLVVAVDRSDPSRAYFGGLYINRYVDGVPSVILWNEVHVDFHVLTFDASGRLWMGSDGGIWRSDDRGATAENLNADLGTALIYPGLACSASGPLYAGMQDNGTARYEGSADWTFVNDGDGFFNAVDPDNTFPAYVTVYNLAITKINADGRCTTYEHVGLPDANDEKRAPFNAPLVMHPTERSVMYAGTYRVWKTTNADSTACGATVWAQESQDFPNWVTTIGPAPSDAGVVYAATMPWKETPAGLYVIKPDDPRPAVGPPRWTNTQANGLPADRHFTDIAVHPNDPATAWVTVSGFVDGAHLYGTTDYGATWTDLDNGLPNAPANAVVVDARGDRPTLYVGTDVGAYASDDGGTNWGSVDANLPNAGVMDLLLDSSGDQTRLVAATFGRGAWSAPLPQP